MCANGIHLAFESRVILDGSQTMSTSINFISWFESRVILDGSQTDVLMSNVSPGFESRVILDGSQTESVFLFNVIKV